jgi:nucleoside-diphosphate kinase
VLLAGLRKISRNSKGCPFAGKVLLYGLIEIDIESWKPKTPGSRNSPLLGCFVIICFTKETYKVNQERTLVIVKPDGVQRGLTGEIISRLESRGLKIVGMKFMQVSAETARNHYSVHEGKPFYEGLVKYITSSPVVVLALEGKMAISAVRNTMGATNPATAAPGTIRGDLAIEVGRNLIHGSDSPESAAKELAIFFRSEELLNWERATDSWIRE